MKQQYLILLLIILFITCCITNPAMAQEDGAIPVFIDRLPVTFDVPAFIQDGRTLAPFRPIAEAGKPISLDVAP